VLTSRQMGKSSLMVRTTRRLKEAGVATVIIDLTSIGIVPVDTWYVGLLARIKSELRLGLSVDEWWRARRTISAPQRLIEFLRDVVLEEVAGPIAIFVDEIDSTLPLAFRDDFFATIRAMYNARASDSTYNRLTFVLLGVATPTDLIRDRERTPFNIGRRIVIEEFSEADARPLHEGLEAAHPGQGDRILARLFYWTNGHPYLTQKLCLAAAQSKRVEWSDPDVDALVEMHFFSRAARKNENLTFVQNRIRSGPSAERRRMFKLYQRVRGAKMVRDDDRSPTQNHLELSGLIGVEQGKLRVRNRIYERVFDDDWIKANMPANTLLSIAVAASVIAIALIAFIGYNILKPAPTPVVEVCVDRFVRSSAAAVRLDALDCLFKQSAREQALRLFYERLTPSEQKYLFLSVDRRAGAQIVEVVKGIYPSLDDEMANDRDLMDAMVIALKSSQQPGTDTLIEEIDDWKQGRELAEQGDYAGAVQAYGRVLSIRHDQPALFFDRAMAYRQLGRYDEAIADLDTAVRLAGKPEAASKPAPTTASTSRFISAVTVTDAVRAAIDGDEQLQSALQKHRTDYPALAAAANDILEAALATQTARAEATQAALAAATTAEAQTTLSAQATGTAVAATAIASAPTEPPLTPTPPPTDTPVPPTPTPTLDTTAVAATEIGQRCFPETGQCISGRILEFWEQNGGLPIFGLPITAQQPEIIEGQTFQKQWFERNSLELHPENPRPYDVLLGRLGADLLAQQGRDPFTFPKSQPQPGCRYFSETEHNVCGDILRTWHSHGLEFDGKPGKSEAENLALFGLPLSDATTETRSDGTQGIVQWFERARLEVYPENAPPYNVLLGRLGGEILRK